MPEDEDYSRSARYGETAMILKGIAEEQLDPRRRNQILALAAAFEQSAARIEGQLRSNMTSH